MKIREATTTDVKQLSGLLNQYRVFYRKDSDMERAQSFIADRLEKKDSEIFVAENDQQELVGFVQLYPLFSSTRMEKLWLLNDLFIDPRYRGKEISVRLIERAKKLVKDSSACAMFLETEKSNIIGNNLYPKTGFKFNKSSNFYEWSDK